MRLRLPHVWLTLACALATLVTVRSVAAASATSVCGTLTADTRWTPASSPYVITCNVTVPENITLTVDPGTVIKFADWTWRLVIDGSLIARGSPNNPIIFTSIHDDAHGGDTNGNGSATSPGPNQWGTIRFNPSSHGILQHTWIAYGGGASAGNIEILDTDHVSIQDSTIGWAHGPGIFVHNASPSITHNLIHENTGPGIEFRGFSTAPLQLTANSFISNTTWAVWADLTDETANITLLNNTSTGSQFNGFGIRGTITGTATYDGDTNFPFIVDGAVTVNEHASLTVTPGTVFKSSHWTSRLVIDGFLIARGSPNNPIIFTSIHDDAHGGDTNGNGSATSPGPNQWGTIRFNPSSHGILQHTWIAYGGGASAGNIEMIGTGDVVIQDSVIGWSAQDGVYMEGASPVISHTVIMENSWAGIEVKQGSRPTVHNNAIFNNARAGAYNQFDKNNGIPVDVTGNWWGDITGPYNATHNPHGQGNEVMDGFLFIPWRRYPPTGTAIVDRVEVHLSGTDRFFPGEESSYTATVANLTEDTIRNAILVLSLPQTAVFLDATGGGIYWPQRHQVFWKLGDLSRWDIRTYTVRIRYLWGIPEEFEDAALLLFGGSNRYNNLFDIQPYLDYQPVAPESAVNLTEQELVAERQRFPQLDALYAAALREGFSFGEATRFRLTDGTGLLRVVLVHLDRHAFMNIVLREQHVVAYTYDDTTFTVEDTNGGLTVALLTGRQRHWGNWQQNLGRPCPDGIQGAGCCMTNCLSDSVVNLAIGKAPVVNNVMKAKACFEAFKTRTAESIANCVSNFIDKVPGLDIAMEVTRCTSSCAGNPSAHDCGQDLVTCDNGWYNVYAWLGVPNKKVYRCIGGCYATMPQFVPCALGERCVPGKGCVDCSLAGVSCRPARFIPARDPNAKFGPESDLLPGQVLTYTITYENEGAGQAYGVFIVDDLSEHLDEKTLRLYGNGRYFTDTRTIIWDIGDLPPKGDAGATGAVSFTVRLRPNLPAGTTIYNQAVVYFPSVPEETPTNVVVNVLRPLVAVPQSVQTEAGQPVPIQLQGLGESEMPLQYTVTEPPLYGTLTGTAPNLTYTPAPWFVGQDAFKFIVSAADSESHPAEVTIRVVPWSGDTTPPAVVDTVPRRGASVDEINSSPLYTDTIGPVYPPLLEVIFTEVISSTTVNTTTVHLRTREGYAVPISAEYSRVLDRLVISPREPLETGQQYWVSLTQGISDLRGNPLERPFTWWFWAGPEQLWRLFMPTVWRTGPPTLR